MILSLLIFIYGLVFGSFLNVIILRLPAEKEIISRSSCTKCGELLKWYHNIPVLSWLFLRGKCGYCHEKISWQYPIIEIICGFITLTLVPEVLSGHTLVIFLLKTFAAYIFLAHLVIDLRHQLLLDSLNIVLLIIFIILALLKGTTIKSIIIGGALGFSIPLLVTWIFYLMTKKIGLGGGDIKLFGVLGLYLGFQGVLLNIFFSCLLGTIIMGSGMLLKMIDRNSPFAFGPFILIVAIVQIYFPNIYGVVKNFIL